MGANRLTARTRAKPNYQLVGGFDQIHFLLSKDITMVFSIIIFGRQTRTVAGNISHVLPPYFKELFDVRKKFIRS